MLVKTEAGRVRTSPVKTRHRDEYAAELVEEGLGTIGTSTPQVYSNRGSDDYAPGLLKQRQGRVSTSRVKTRHRDEYAPEPVEEDPGTSTRQAC